MTNHTPTPWLPEVHEYGGGTAGFDVLSINGRKEKVVAGLMSKADAVFIVEACNSHDRLLAERDELAKTLQSIVIFLEMSEQPRAIAAVTIARAVLAKVQT